ncbi:MAG: hydantoinase/oxoprolinase family protein [Candidatus Binataceae bacterium]|jgi:N-methylhydantoinase A/oxoprolinase/acetone carboxylase beta subunit
MAEQRTAIPAASERTPQILGVDAGGTMTDTIFIDRRGQFTIGKALSTPADESEGLARSARDALGYWDLQLDRVVPSLRAGVYSGTSMLNRLLERKGRKLGLIVTAGMEDVLRMERSRQTYTGYSYSDRLHAVTHMHNEPLVPLERIRGVRERIDIFGDVAIPLYEEEAHRAVAELLESGVEALCVNLLHSYRNPLHEQRVAAIAREVCAKQGKAIPIFVASELNPVRDDFPRLNTVIMEAYAADPSREQLRRIQDQFGSLGAKFQWRIVASYGGSLSIESPHLFKTLVSGPIGGMIGSKYLSSCLGTPNLVCTDVGGTSFDVGIITANTYTIRTQPETARYLLALPMVMIDSVGAGMGTVVRLNPYSRRIELGPDSAGARIGLSYPEGGMSVPSLTDCHVILGILDPNYFLGGEIKLDRERAFRGFKEQIADPLGLDVYAAAAGVIELLTEQMHAQVRGALIGKGYSPVEYTLMAYGGGGPVLVSRYAQGFQFQDILVPTWAAAFSAFGCTCADLEIRHDMTVDVRFGLKDSAEQRREVVKSLTQAWATLRERVAAEITKGGWSPNDASFRRAVRMQYQGQFDDLEVASIHEGDDTALVERLTASFEELYGKVYSLAARSPELGYAIARVIVTAVLPTVKPDLLEEEQGTARPAREAWKGKRRVWWERGWQEAEIWEMRTLRPGNVVDGLAIIEAPSTTFVVPPGASAFLDGHRVFHLDLNSRNGKAH